MFNSAKFSQYSQDKTVLNKFQKFQPDCYCSWNSDMNLGFVFLSQTCMNLKVLSLEKP